jgi:hypothetical protein
MSKNLVSPAKNRLGNAALMLNWQFLDGAPLINFIVVQLLPTVTKPAAKTPF